MADYERMYKTMFQATELAVNILIRARRECDEMYMNAQEEEMLRLERGPVKEGDAAQTDQAEREEEPGP